MPARPLATFENLQLAPSPALPLRWCPWRTLGSRTCLWGCWGLVAAGVAPGTPGWWAPLRRGLVGPAGIAAVGAGARVKGTAMAGGPRVAGSAAAAAQFLVATGGGRPACEPHFSAAAGSLEPQDQGLISGAASTIPTSSLCSRCPPSAAEVRGCLWHLDVVGREIFAELWIFYKL